MDPNAGVVQRFAGQSFVDVALVGREEESGAF